MPIFLNGCFKFIKSPNYPAKFPMKDGYKNSFILGIGGNVGGVEATRKRFEKFLMLLLADKRFCVISASSIVLNKAFGYENQPDFLNAVLYIKTSKSPNETLRLMQHYEFKFLRKRSFKNAPRTLDLDILYFDKAVREQPRLIIPHPGVNSRISVILPLGEIL